jgi:hypothetical protein
LCFLEAFGFRLEVFNIQSNLKFLVKTFLGKENDMRKLIALLAMSFLVLLPLSSGNVFAESPNDKILKKLDQIQRALDHQVIPKLDECCQCLECPECKAGVPKTGQTTMYGPGDDGALQKGIPFPMPRFIDNGNGTVTDNLTGLVWLKNANCFGQKTWTEALDASNNLNQGICGLTDGSISGNWRLPNIKELQSLLDYGQAPALPPGHPFINLGLSYWTSTAYYGSVFPDDFQAWFVEIGNGVVNATRGYVGYSVWPVRDTR